MALVGAALLVRPGILPGRWGLRSGALFILLAYGFGWQAIRKFYGRSSVLPFVFGLPLSWFALSVAIFEGGSMFALSASMRAFILAIFNGLCAREFWLNRDDGLPSRTVLFWIFVVYCTIDLARIPFTAFIPLPLGGAKTEVWAVVLYNVLAVLLALVVTSFMIAMSRERVSMQHYQLALRDALTGVYNRRAYIEHMQAFDAGAVQSTVPFSLLVFDIDRFKSINDRFGHDMGDRIIKLAARAAGESLRKDDSIFRVGGEEFVCVLPGTAIDQAYEAAERIRLTFQKQTADVDGVSVQATLSVGVAASDGKSNLPSTIFAHADKALYEAKDTGRNRTVKAKYSDPERA